ncbi:MAG: monooxygenase, partial [Cyanobacteria bacterium J06588_5]
PDNSRLGYLAQVENNELIATLGGYENQYPPLEEDAFLAFAQQLSDPSFSKAIASLTPTTPIKAYRSTANKRRRYDQLEHMPTGFIAIGDAVCALCPAYGQGLTTSGQSAVVLQDWLSQSELTHTLAFQKKLEKAIKPSYDVAAGSDSGFVSTKGRIPKGRVAKVMNSYMRRLFTIAHTDGDLNLSLIKIAHMIDSPIKLFHPKILLKMI